MAINYIIQREITWHRVYYIILQPFNCWPFFLFVIKKNMKCAFKCVCQNCSFNYNILIFIITGSKNVFDINLIINRFFFLWNFSLYLHTFRCHHYWFATRCSLSCKGHLWLCQGRCRWIELWSWRYYTRYWIRWSWRSGKGILIYYYFFQCILLNV